MPCLPEKRATTELGMAQRLELLDVAHFGDERSENLGGTGADAARFQVAFAALHVGDETACFENDQGARGEIPAFQVVFPEGVHAAAGNPGEVKSCRPRTAQARGGARHAFKLRHEGSVVVRLAEGEAGADQGLREIRTSGDADAGVVHEGPLTFFRIEEFVAARVVDDADRQLAAVGHADAHGVLRETVQEVRRPIQGIDVPNAFGVRVFGDAVFFRDETVTREGGLENAVNRFLAFGVDSTEEIELRFFVHFKRIDVAAFATDDFACLEGGANGRLQLRRVCHDGGLSKRKRGRRQRGSLRPDKTSIESLNFNGKVVVCGMIVEKNMHNISG